jgi:hypothetical protein
MGRASYAPPQVTDHGSLVALTADFHVNFVGPMSTILQMAVVSAPIGSGNISPGDVVSPTVPSGGGGTGNVPISGGPTGTDVVSGSPGGGGGNLLSGGGGSSPGGGGGGGVPTATGDPGALGGGKLPFTGYAATTAAYLGAVFTMTGIAIRTKLRRST